MSNEFFKPSVTCDMVAVNSHLSPLNDKGSMMSVVLVKRSLSSDAYPGAWALPGGFLEEDETLEQCAVREFLEETGLSAKLLAPVGVFADVGRDPRGRVISHAYMTVLISSDQRPLVMKAGDDAKEVKLFSISGSFTNPEEGTELKLRLFCVESGECIEYTTTFERAAYGVIRAHVKYDNEKSNTMIAFDHAEIIARAVLRAPDIISTENKYKASPVVHADPGKQSSKK